MLKACCFVFIIWSFIACSPNNVRIDTSFEKYFKENKVEGCFGMFNNGNGQFTVYNLDRYKDSAYLPASTFKIVNSLIGLQTGIASNTRMIIKWDGVTRNVAEWNKDLTIYEAFRVSAVPYFQELARRIGKDTMQFWLDNSLKITPDEQLGLVKKLYFRQLPFYAAYQDTVKKLMLFEDKPAYKLSYKTGWGQTQNGSQIGWVVGWIEENRHPYFFVLNIDSKDKNLEMPIIRMKILKNILNQLGFMKGKK